MQSQEPPPDEWVPVTSSNVAAVAHDLSAKALWVRFNSGHQGYYAGVRRDVYEEMLAAPSKGKFVHQRLIPNYRWVRA